MWNQSCRIQNFHRWSSTNCQNRLSTRRRPSCLFRQGRLDVLERFGHGSSFVTDRHLFLLFRTLKKSQTETSDERLKINKNIFNTWYDSRQAKNEFFSHFLICLNSVWAYAFYIFFKKTCIHSCKHCFKKTYESRFHNFTDFNNKMVDWTR